MESAGSMFHTYNFKMGALFGCGLGVAGLSTLEVAVYYLCIKKRRATAGVEQVDHGDRIDVAEARLPRRLSLRRRLRLNQQEGDVEVERVDAAPRPLRRRVRGRRLQERPEIDSDPDDDDDDDEEVFSDVEAGLNPEHEPRAGDQLPEDEEREEEVWSDLEIGLPREQRREAAEEDDASLLTRCLRVMGHGILLLSAAAIRASDALKEYAAASAAAAAAARGGPADLPASPVEGAFVLNPVPQQLVPTVDCSLPTAGPCAPRGITASAIPLGQ